MDHYEETIKDWVIQVGTLPPAPPSKTIMMEIAACTYWRYLEETKHEDIEDQYKPGFEHIYDL
jgi:hypothetical protein